MSTQTPDSPAISEARRSALIGAVADSHGTSDAMILRRIRAVSAALTAGLDVKTLTSEINAAAAVPGSSVTPISAPVLGQARAVLTFLDKVGVSLPTAVAERPAALVAVYRAASTKRAGVKGIGAVAAEAVNGEDTASKLAIAEESAERAGKGEARRTGGKPAEGEPEHVTVTDLAAVLAALAGRVASGALEPDAAFVAALGALVQEVQRVAAARPVRARIATAEKVAA